MASLCDVLCVGCVAQDEIVLIAAMHMRIVNCTVCVCMYVILFK